MFWEKEIETASRSELRRLQLSRLKKTLRQAAKSSGLRENFQNPPGLPGEDQNPG